MGWVHERSRASGMRYTAHYRDVRGIAHSAGTFRTEREAVRAWHRAEESLALGQVGDPSRGKQTLVTYVERD